jgi:acetoin:2,6-dichlorophenolindophenol oxidoreductase subunit alpha
VPGASHVVKDDGCHGHYLALTGDGLGLMSEIMSKAPASVAVSAAASTYVCRGSCPTAFRAGSCPLPRGIALARQLDGSDRVRLVVIGDGTLGEGVVQETLNIAALWRLPLLLICEDNHWAQSTPVP